MRVKILKKCFAGTGGNLWPGEEHDLPDRKARKMIAGGYAEAVKRKTKRKSKDDDQG